MSNEDSIRILANFVDKFGGVLSRSDTSTQPTRPVTQKQRERWNELAGARADEFLSDRLIAEAALRHSDNHIRLAAYQIILRHWGTSRESGALYLLTATDDRDDRVRSVAVSCLMSVFSGTKNFEVSEKLSKIVLDVENPTYLRADAYYALLVIHRQEDRFRWTYISASDKTDFESHIDVAFLRSVTKR